MLMLLLLALLVRVESLLGGSPFQDGVGRFFHCEVVILNMDVVYIE